MSERCDAPAPVSTGLGEQMACDRTRGHDGDHEAAFADSRSVVVWSTPTPARSEAPDPVWGDPIPDCPRCHGTGTYRATPDSRLRSCRCGLVVRSAAKENELASLREQLAAAREDGERVADLAAAAIYRLSEGAHRRTVDQAYGLAPVTTDFGEDIGRLREALGITVGYSAPTGYVFTRSDRARTEPAREGEGGNG